MFDELWPGGPKFHQAEYGFKLGTDSVLLAHFTNPTRAKKILDLGCGAGVLTVLTAYKAPKDGENLAYYVLNNRHILDD